LYDAKLPELDGSSGPSSTLSEIKLFAGKRLPARARVLALRIWGSVYFPDLVCRLNFANVGRQRDADSLKNAADVAGHGRAQ
jgi:hypothetical protein